MYKHLVLICCSFLLVACSASGPSYSAFESQTTRDTGVYIYRTKHLIPGGSAPILIDGKAVGSLKDAGFIYAPLTPGAHTIATPNKSSILSRTTYITYPIHLNKHQQVYVKVEWLPSNETRRSTVMLSSGISSYQTQQYNWSFQEVAGEQGSQEVRRLNLSN